MPYYHPSASVLCLHPTSHRLFFMQVKDIQVGMQLVSHYSLLKVTTIRKQSVDAKELRMVCPKRNHPFLVHSKLSQLHLRSCGTNIREYGELCTLRLSDQELQPEWLRARFKMYRNVIPSSILDTGSKQQQSPVIPPYLLAFFVTKHKDLSHIVVDCPEVFERLQTEIASYTQLQIRRNAPFVKRASGGYRPVTCELYGERWSLFIRTASTNSIPHELLLSDLETRAQLMSGFLDNVGYMSKYSFVYEIFVQNEGLINQIKLLAGTLGLHISHKSKMPDVNKLDSQSSRRQYKKMYISGDLEAASVRCADPSKIPRVNKYVKVNSCGFDVKALTEEELERVENEMTHLELSTEDRVIRDDEVHLINDSFLHF